MMAVTDRVEVVGVVKDLQWTSALQQADPVAYLTFWQQDRENRVAQDSRTYIRVAGDAAGLLPEILRSIASIDPDVPISEAGSLGARLDAQFKDVGAARTMLVTFGALGLSLSMIGLYAALAFAVGERTREIAIRVAPFQVNLRSDVLMVSCPVSKRHERIDAHRAPSTRAAIHSCQ